MTRYRVAIRQTPSSVEPFWRSPWYATLEKANDVAKRNQALIRRQRWTHVVLVEIDSETSDLSPPSVIPS